MSSPMRHAMPAHHPHFAASSWATMDALGYGSDGDDEFRSPNGLDLETSSEEGSPTNYSSHPHAASHDGFAPQYRVPGVNDDVLSSANALPREGSVKNAQDLEAEYRLRVQMAYNRGDMPELEKVLIETRDAPPLAQVRKVTKKALKKLLAQRVLDEPLAFGAPAQAQAPQAYPPVHDDLPAALKSAPQESNIGLARKNDNTCVMDLLPGVVGWVIGRAGTRIKEIQGQSGCKMWVDQDVPDDQPRKLYFHGSKPNIDAAVQLVNDLLQSAPILAGKHGQVSRLTSHIMDCPPDLVGLLIGKKGWTIKKIQQESGAQISINQSVREGLPRKIIISGTEDAVHAAIALIEEVLKNKQDVPTRYVTVDDTVRTISLPTTISPAGLANARAVPPGRVVATSGGRPVFATDSLGNTVLQPELMPEVPAHLNSAPPGFHIPVPNHPGASAHGIQRPQARSASPQLLSTGQHGTYIPQSQSQPMLNGYGDASTMAPAHAQQQINPGLAYSPQHQHVNAWQHQQQHQQQQIHMMHLQQQQQQQQRQMQQHPHHPMAHSAQAGFHHTGYQQQLDHAVSGALPAHPQHLAQPAAAAHESMQPPASYAAAAAVAAAAAAAGSPPESALVRSMHALSVAEDAAVDSLLSAAAVVGSSAPQQIPPAPVASPLWQPSSMLPADNSTPSESVSSLAAPGATLPFDALGSSASSELPLAGHLPSVGLTGQTQNLLMASSTSSQHGWDSGVGQTF